MSDWRDVMAARNDADAARSACDQYGGAIEDGRTGDVALAVLLAASALCAEVRALAVVIDYGNRER